LAETVNEEACQLVMRSIHLLVLSLTQNISYKPAFFPQSEWKHTHTN